MQEVRVQDHSFKLFFMLRSDKTTSNLTTIKLMYYNEYVIIYFITLSDVAIQTIQQSATKLVTSFKKGYIIVQLHGLLVRAIMR